MENETVEEVEEAEEVAEVDQCTRAESAANIYSTFAEIDVEIMSESDKNKVKEIRRMALDIVHRCLKKVNDETKK